MPTPNSSTVMIDAVWALMSNHPAWAISAPRPSVTRMATPTATSGINAMSGER